MGPIMTPIFAHIGRSRNALDWYLLLLESFKKYQFWAHFFSLTISLTIVLITPTFPFKAPPSILKIKACQKVVANPNPRQEIIVPERPIKSTLFRPP
jgi:hypothetical protein